MTLHPMVLRELAADRTAEVYAQAHRTSAAGLRPNRRTLSTSAAAVLSRPLLGVGWSMVELGLRLRAGRRLPARPRAARG